MRRHILALGASALCLVLAPTLALGAQGNEADADTNAVNANASGQLIGQSGGGSAEQSATNVQLVPVAVAPAVAPQVLPVNLNVPVSVASTGEPAEVEQSNEADADAEAANINGSSQAIFQGGGGKDGKDGKGGGSGYASQSAKNVQVLPIALAPAIAPQVLPVNANVPLTVGNPLAVLPPLPVDPLAPVTGALGTVSGLAGALPLDAVTGLLPLGAVTGLLPVGLPALPVGI